MFDLGSIFSPGRMAPRCPMGDASRPFVTSARPAYRDRPPCDRAALGDTLPTHDDTLPRLSAVAPASLGVIGVDEGREKALDALGTESGHSSGTVGTSERPLAPFEPV